MLIVQISDTHIAGWDKKTYGIAPMVNNLRLCVEHINQLIPKPDLVLVTGDITNTGRIEEFEQAASLLNELTAPYYVIPGNHDNRTNLLSAFAGRACPAENIFKQQGFINYVIDDFELRLIAMDSTVIYQAGGEICKLRASWLDERLTEGGEKPTILFMHHPPVKLGVKETDIDGFAGSEKLGDVIEKYTHIERILCGHVHSPIFVRWRGTVVSTAPSMGMQLVLDLTLQQSSQFILEAPAYQLHHWTAEKNLISHIVKVQAIDKTYLFEDDSNVNE